MEKTVTIDPITRIEGHLGIRLEVESNRVVNAYSSGEMFRGFEAILKGRDPLDAQQITQRICGVCPVSHGMASILAQDMAYGITPTKNGRLMRNLILGANYIQSHIIHFYHLCALDFIDITAITKYSGKDPGLLEVKAWVESQLSSNSIYPAAPFLPRYDSKYIDNTDLNIAGIKHYLEALELRRLAHKMGALFAGKLPHAATLIPGGVTEKVDAKKIVSYKEMLHKLQIFIDNSYIPDVLAVAAEVPGYFKTGIGCGNFLSYGVFSETEDGSDKFLPSGVIINGKPGFFDESKITEDVKYSLYSSPSGNRPDQGETTPDPEKYGAYSWLKAPRYNKTVMEVGPLARILVAYHKNHNSKINNMVDNVLKQFNARPINLISTLGRHAVRAIECKLVADRCAAWLDQLLPNKKSYQDFDIPKVGNGIGLTEAPRGALGHWIQIDNHKIENYQCVVPTTWNCSPRDDGGYPGAVEQALVGTPIENTENPIEATRIVRSFDPCIACAVH